MKDAMENINIPKMPKLHRPGFMKKKSKEGEKTEGEKAEGEKTEEENAEMERSKEKLLCETLRIEFVESGADQ